MHAAVVKQMQTPLATVAVVNNSTGPKYNVPDFYSLSGTAKFWLSDRKLKTNTNISLSLSISPLQALYEIQRGDGSSSFPMPPFSPINE